MAYLDSGEGPPVILIHGLGGSMWHWEHQQVALARSCRIITPDLLGAGLSEKPERPYTPTFLLDTFRAFMDNLNIQKAALIGSSMGAGIAIGMSLKYPARVTRTRADRRISRQHSRQSAIIKNQAVHLAPAATLAVETGKSDNRPMVHQTDPARNHSRSCLDFSDGRGTSSPHALPARLLRSHVFTTGPDPGMGNDVCPAPDGNFALHAHSLGSLRQNLFPFR